MPAVSDSDPRHPADASEALHDAVAAASRRVAGRLLGRYVPLYAAVAALLLIGALVPSTVSREGQARAQRAVGTAPGASASVEAPAPAGASVSTPAPPAAALSAPPPPGAPGALTPAASLLPAGPTGDSGFGAAPGSPGGGAAEPGGNDGFGEEVPPCPLAFGEDPVVSRGVAAVLLGAASPALSLLGPLGPNAVPALGAASPLLPVIAPVADAFGPYVRTLNPLFLQISGFATTLWDGPLQPLEAPLLELNASIIQPFEVELLAALTDPINQINATPLTPCLQRVLYNVVAPLPIPDPPSLPVPAP